MGDARGESSVGGFWAFYRDYTDTGVHTATMAALTAFGLLTFAHRAFVVVAVAAYVLPPIALYLTRDGDDEGATDVDEGAAGPADAESGSAADPGGDVSDGARGNAGNARGVAPAEWTAERTPTDATLRDVTALSSGAVAVGDGGVVLGRDGAGDGYESDAGGWSVLVADGPAAEGRDLTGVAATDDGAAAWLCGANGAVGRYDAETGRHADRSAPRDVTDSWTDVAVTGRAGEETVYLANGSGEVVRGAVGDDGVSWDAPVAPGGGSSIAAVDADADGAVRACDTNGGVFEFSGGGAESGGGGLRFAHVGVDGASGTFTDVAAAGGRVRVTADDGSVYRDDGGWTRDRPVETRLAAVAADADAAVAVGDGGTVCLDDGGGWATVPVPADASLEGVALDADACVAVGDAGTVLRVGRAGVDASRP